MAKTGKSTNHPKLTLYSTLKTYDESGVVEEAEAGRFTNLRSVWSIDRVISRTAKAIQKNPVDGVGDKKKSQNLVFFSYVPYSFFAFDKFLDIL